MAPGTARMDLTFIVRVSRDRDGRLRGIVERVKTGEKHRFEHSEGIGGLIERMVAAAEAGQETR
ncbi:MAG TPA: hypothetical protein VGT40_07510 [Methylomirabilota bacterium]|jgi:hypothetical protein|nr:hypothetical protein [Methylomirabilota bacterium]